MSSNNKKSDLVLRDINNGEIFLLKSRVRPYLCGRSKNADVRTDSIMASREHCLFTYVKGELRVCDVGSSNGTFVNGARTPELSTNVLLNVGDLIGIGCPEVTVTLTTSHPSTNNGGGAVRPQIKTVYRLEIPQIELQSEDAIPSTSVQGTTIDSPKSTNENRRLSKDSSDDKVPCKKLKVSEEIPDVIDLADDSNDGIPVSNDNWNRPSTSSNPFTMANLSAIKVDPFGAISTSREKDSSSRVVGSDTSHDSDNSPCDSTTNTRVENSHTSPSLDSKRRAGKVAETRREDRSEEKLKSNEKENNINAAKARPNQSNVVASSNEFLKPEKKAMIVDSDSEDEIDILKREDCTVPDDESSHSSWEEVEDFSIPGYNSDEVQNPEEKVTAEAVPDDAAIDQQFKYEPELNIIDNDESFYKDDFRSSQTFTPTPLKLKRVVKQEPITEYSQHDFVELSDDEEDVFPASQLFGDDEGLEIEKKVKNENEQSDEENERSYDRRDCDSPLLIQLSDSEEELEHNPWYNRLMRAEINASRESLIHGRDRDELEDNSEEDVPMSPPPEKTSTFLTTGIPESPIKDDGPSSPFKSNLAMSPPAEKTSTFLKTGIPFSPNKEDPSSPLRAKLPKSSPAKKSLIFPAARAPVSPNEHPGPSSPPEGTIAEDDQPGSPFNPEAEIHELFSPPNKDEEEEEEIHSKKDSAKSIEKRPKLTDEHTTKKDRSKSNEKRPKLTEEQTTKRDIQEKEKSHKDESSSKKKSHHHTKQISSSRTTDSEISEGKIRKKSKDHKGEKSKQSIESTAEKRRDSTEEKSNNEIRASHSADSSSSKKRVAPEEERVAPEEETNVRMETPSIAERNEARRRSLEEKSRKIAETRDQLRDNGLPIVLVTKVDHVKRKGVQIVDAPNIGNNQRRGFSCKVIDKAASTPDDQRPSTSGLQNQEPKRTKPTPPKERKLSAQEKKDLAWEAKALAKQKTIKDRRRRQLHAWAATRPTPRPRRPIVVIPTQPIVVNKEARTKKLKEIAVKEKEPAEAMAPPVNRPVTKVKAKVTQKTRNDFLVDDFVDKSAKPSTSAERPSLANTDKINDAKKQKDDSMESRKQSNVSDVKSNSDKQAANLKNQTVTPAEIPATHDSSFSSDSSEHEDDPSSYQFGRASTTNDKPRMINGVQSPKGKKRPNESSDLIKERLSNYEIPPYKGPNFYRENNEHESEISSSHVEKENREMSPNKMKRKNNSPDRGRKKARNGRDPINNENVDKSTIHTGDSRATQSDRQWHEKTNGMRVLEETDLDCRRTLNNNIIHEKESTVATRDPRLKTGKPAKLKSLLKKPRRSIGKSRVIKRVTFDDHNTKVQLFEIDPGNSLRKCDFKESLVAIRQNSSANSKVPVAVDCPKLEEFLLRIFEWNPVWLKEQNFMQGPPPVVKEKSLVRVKPRYESYKDYYAIFEPLMALELWYGISKDYDDREKDKQRTNSVVFSVVENSVTRTTVPSTNINVTTLMIEIVVSKKELRERAHPAFGDLIFFEYTSNIRAKQGGFQRWKVFAYVTKLHQCILTPRTIYNHDLAKYVSDPHMLLTLTVMTKPLNPIEMQTNTLNRLGTISYLRSNIRLIQALQSLPTSVLSPMILNPKIEDYKLPPADNVGFYPLVTKDKLNPKQLEAVVRVTEAVVQKLPKICLIQGPPGTGKSKVIVNMMMQILYGRGKNTNRRGMRILVCAPSNAAIDEIVLRLLEIRRTFEKGHRFNMVRIGRDHTMHPMVKEVSLTELAKKNVKATADSYKSPEFTPECLQEEKNRLQACKNSLELQLATGKNLDPVRLKQLKNKLSDIEASYGLLMSGRSAEHLDEKESFKLQRGAENSLLKGADVIACTLSSCYTEIMQSVFVETDATISVCIVDEATQSIEAETLVPLMLGVKTLVLVGDTNQLPATVLSQRAKGLGLDQSLFARIQRSFEGLDPMINPIILLDTQYRMSYHVAYWPNRYFYAGAIKNSELLPNVASNLYKVINLDSTQDMNKFTNTNEANFVASLVYTIMARSTWDNSYQQVRIGIITPYNNQKTLITSKIKERTALLSEKTKKRYVHEVNTVDSFQGQERDIIIMSCVRSNGIGFLSDRQRLCVALTRAKNSLILCGNFGTFQTNAMWNALITDAKGRGVFLDMRANAGIDEIMKNIFRQREIPS